jgi:hypothetical protein
VRVGYLVSGFHSQISAVCNFEDDVRDYGGVEQVLVVGIILLVEAFLEFFDFLRHLFLLHLGAVIECEIVAGLTRHFSRIF